MSEMFALGVTSYALLASSDVHHELHQLSRDLLFLSNVSV